MRVDSGPASAASLCPDSLGGARRPPLALLRSGCCVHRLNALRSFLLVANIDPLLWFAAAAPAAPLTLAARRCSRLAEGEGPAGSGIPPYSSRRRRRRRLSAPRAEEL